MKRVSGFFICLSLLWALSAFGAAGDIVSVTGEVSVQREGQMPVRVTRETKIETNDVVLTAADGLVQFRLANQAETGMRQNSHLRIGDAELALTRGTLQVNTRSMGPDDHLKFRVRTPVAVIGFRGTETIVRHVDSDNTTIVHTLIGSNSVAGADEFPPVVTMPNDTVQVIGGKAPRLIPAGPGPAPSKPPAK
jgi:hypothetical protein